MKRLLIALLITLSLDAAIDIRTPVLAKQHVSGSYYRWADQELFTLITKTQNPEVITICDNGGWFDPANLFWDWCKKPAHYKQWQALKDYYLLFIELNDDIEVLPVTGDQLFCVMDHSYGLKWISAARMYGQSNNGSWGFYINRSPYWINNVKQNKPQAHVAFMYHVTAADDLEKEFFDITVDDAHTYVVGKGHYWIHNMGGTVLGLNVEWTIDTMHPGVINTAAQGATPGSVSGNVGPLPFYINLDNQPHTKEWYQAQKDFAWHDLHPPVVEQAKYTPDERYKHYSDKQLEKGIQSQEKVKDNHVQKLIDTYAKRSPDPKGLKTARPDLADSIDQGSIKHYIKEITDAIQNKQDMAAELARRTKP